MKYTSTRSNETVNASLAILNGLAKDGGLYVPESIPTLDLNALKDTSYQSLAFEILSLFLDDFNKEDLKQTINSAYNENNFSHESITGLRKYNDNTYFLELFYGKTSAFKDQALSLYPYLLKLAMKEHDIDHLSILTATSGDTGKAAMEAISDVEGLSIAVLFPKDGTSFIQKLQMQSQKGNNVYPLAIEGNFDDAQSAVKEFFLKHQDLPITSANSINIARLLPQIVYYYDLVHRLNTVKPINVYVPTGNFGNILAAFIAKEMGLPIQKLIVCTNNNNVLYEFFKTGVYDISTKTFEVTHSPSMDILISSNLERMLYFMFKDKEKVAGWMEDLKNNKRFQLSKSELQKLQETFDTQMCTNECTYEAIQEVYEASNILIDPHTATALPQDESEALNVIVSTASPYKFPKLYNKLFNLNSKDDFYILNKIDELTDEPYPPFIKELETIDVRFNQNIKLEEIESVLKEFIIKEAKL